LHRSTIGFRGLQCQGYSSSSFAERGGVKGDNCAGEAARSMTASVAAGGARDCFAASQIAAEGSDIRRLEKSLIK
jgi:hypothetical protein